MQKFDLKDVCFFDCETTGVPAKGLKWDADFEQFPHVVQLAWSLGDKEKSYIIKPDNYEIPPETTAIHGITTERAIKEGVPFAEVVNEFLADANAAPLVCAHNIYFDSSMLKANVLRYCGREYYDAHVEDALHKGKRIDTMMKTIKFVGALYSNGRPGKYPKLEELYSKLFPGETFPAHDALEDIRALRSCVPELVNLGIIELVQKEYPAEQLKAQFEPEKPKGGRNIEFHDPNPVTEPIGTGEPVPEPTPEPEEGKMIDPRDNHEYKIVTIGEQIWMAENLAYLPSVSKPEDAATSDGDPLYFVFNYDGKDVNAAKATKEYKTYGVLYNWYAAMNQKNATGGNADAIPSGIQGICPNGWHLPSKAEWKKLENFVADELAPVEGNVWTDDEGNKYSDKDCKNVWSALTGKLDADGWGESGMIDENPDLAKGPRDTYGFNVIPAGQCYQSGSFEMPKSQSRTDFWSTDQATYGAGTVYFSNMSYGLGYSSDKGGIQVKRGLSVRCVKD